MDWDPSQYPSKYNKFCSHNNFVSDMSKAKKKTDNMYMSLTWNIVYNNNHVTQKDVQMYF